MFVFFAEKCHRQRVS